MLFRAFVAGMKTLSFHPDFGEYRPHEREVSADDTNGDFSTRPQRRSNNRVRDIFRDVVKGSQEEGTDDNDSIIPHQSVMYSRMGDWTEV